MKWMEFTTIDERSVLVNVGHIQCIKASSNTRTDLIFQGFSIEVQGSYPEILDRLRKFEQAAVETWIGPDGRIEGKVRSW